MQSPLGLPLVLLFPSPPLTAALAVAVTLNVAWAWAETVRRLRESEAALNRPPRFAILALVALTALGLGAAAATVAAPAAPWGVPTQRTAAVIALLAALGLALVAALSRLGRVSRWPDFLRQSRGRHAERQVAGERTDVFAAAVQHRLDPSITALHESLHSVRRLDNVAQHMRGALDVIDTEVERLRGLRSFAGQWQQPAAEIASVPDACQEVVQRAATIFGAAGAINLYGEENIQLRMPRRHLDALLWGAIVAARSASDPEEPVVEFTFRRTPDAVVIELEANGAWTVRRKLPDDAHQAVLTAKAALDLHGGHMDPSEPPFGRHVEVRLPGSLVVPTREEPAHDDVVRPYPATSPPAKPRAGR